MPCLTNASPEYTILGQLCTLSEASPTSHRMLVMFAERLQRLAATAPNIGAVQEAVALAFPPSQGSAKRAEKFKQFCSDVMSPGTKFKVCSPPGTHHKTPLSPSLPFPLAPCICVADLQRLSLCSRLTTFECVIYVFEFRTASESSVF